MYITKLPDNLDPNKLIEKEILKKNSECPFCKGKNIYKHHHAFISYRYGFQKPWYKHITEGMRHWQRIFFTCLSCNAEWYSDEYPTDIKVNISDINKYLTNKIEVENNDRG